MNVRRIAQLLPLVAIIYLVGPVGFQVLNASGTTGAAEYRQLETAARTLNAAEVVNWQSLASAWSRPDTASTPIVLTYHDVAEDSESEYAVTPLQFAEQMNGLAAAGAHVMTAEEFRAFQDGAPAAPRSVLITFDDGTLGVWRYAEPILRSHNFPAVAFVITGSVGTRWPYYMGWPQIDELVATGRWAIEAHTHLGHRKIATGGNGETGSFLSSLLWLPEGAGRLETLDEYRDRIVADLDSCVEQLRLRGMGRAGLFAYPFSDFGAASNDVLAPVMLDALIRQRFGASFNTGINPLALRGPFQYNRLTVARPTTSVLLMDQLTQIIDRNFTVLAQRSNRPA